MSDKRAQILLSAGVVAFFLGCGTTQNNGGNSARQLETSAMVEAANPSVSTGGFVHSLVQPHDEPIFPPGPGREEFVTACVVCHSPRYISMQPKFSRSTWLSEVNKMKNVYGAHISENEAAKIADYLVFYNGKADDPNAPKGTYGE